MADIWLDSVASRLEKLESTIYDEAEKDANYPKVVETLANVNSQISAATAGKTKIEPVMKRLNDLEKYLDPSYAENLALSQVAKAETILAQEEQIRKQAADLEKVEKMLPVLNSEHIKGVPNLKDKLYSLSQINIEQQDKSSEFTDEVKELLTHYNNIITVLSKQFVQWDEVVTNLEMAKQIKKPID